VKLGFLFAAFFGALIFAGCGTPQPTASPLDSPVAVAPLVADSPLNPNTLPEGPVFTVELPLKSGDMIVRGTGRASVPLRVVSVTQMASTLGNGVVGSDGRFQINVAPPLVEGERVGLMIGDLTGTPFTSIDFLRGPGYSDLPFIGVVFTSTLVIP
jgi:hypothetical protein